MWEIDIKFQLLTFLFACILGALYSAFYDVFRALRLVKNQKPFTIFLEDLFYFITLAFITFFYLLAFTNGEVRFYVIIGIVLGFIVFYILLSKYNLLLLKCLFKIIFHNLKTSLKNFYFSKGFHLEARTHPFFAYRLLLCVRTLLIILTMH